MKNLLTLLIVSAVLVAITGPFGLGAAVVLILLGFLLKGTDDVIQERVEEAGPGGDGTAAVVGCLAILATLAAGLLILMMYPGGG